MPRSKRRELHLARGGSSQTRSCGGAELKPQEVGSEDRTFDPFHAALGLIVDLYGVVGPGSSYTTFSAERQIRALAFRVLAKCDEQSTFNQIDPDPGCIKGMV